MVTQEVDQKLNESDNFTKTRILKNLFVLSLSFLLISTSMDGLSLLQSTLNRKEGIGVTSTAVSLATGCITAIFLMKFGIKKLGGKNAIALGMLVHIPGTGANFYPHWLTMIPAYALMGIVTTLQCGSNSAYLTKLSNLYSNHLLKMNTSKNPGSNLREDLLKIKKNMLKINSLSIVLESFRSNSKENSDLVQCAKTESSDLTKRPVLFRPDNFDKNCVEESSLTFLSSQAQEQVCPKVCSPIENNYTNLTVNGGLSEDSIVSTIENGKTSQIFNELVEDNFNRETKDFQISLVESIKSTKHNEKCSSPVAVSYIEWSSKIIESTAARFFGFHSMFYMSGHIWSNITSFYVLQQGVLNDSYIHDSSCMCGADFCNVETHCFESNLKEPPEELKFLLLSIFMVLHIMALLLIVFFLDPLEEREKTIHFSLDFALASFNQLKKPFQLLLIPLSLYMGITKGFFYADFTKAFVGCAWGMHHIGLVTIVFGISTTIFSSLSAWLVKHLGRRIIFLAAFSVNVAVNVLMLLWSPDSNHPEMFFSVTVMWGFMIGSFWSQVIAFYGVLFKDNQEAAFGCYELFQSLGCCIFFAWSNLLCAYVKIYIMLFISSLGIIGYLVVENYRNKNN